LNISKNDAVKHFSGHMPMNKMNSLIPVERQQQIVEILRDQLTVSGSKLSGLLGVSEMTIRRDLDALEKQGLVERTHGGAVFRQERLVGKFHYGRSTHVNPKEKRRIAACASKMIEPNDTVYIGEGYTAAQILRYVDPNLRFTIFSNNIGVTAEMGNKSAELIMLPGTYDPTTNALAGPLTMEMIRQVNANKVFLGVDGFSLSLGLTTPNLEIAVIDRSMIQQTRRKVIVMTDHSKFGLVAEISITPLKHIDVLVTNRNIPEDYQKSLDAMGIEVVIA
jgi:DeoR/GlpR family transcriptional regulator of sugar metabolism